VELQVESCGIMWNFGQSPARYRKLLIPHLIPRLIPHNST